ncbi:DUF7574 domain-containing protein [Kutzneria albida]|uniref:DUF7574 domain-containing protein n=1 Tax=Kutzneria albida DSM 43870 TaxID=1449976 RepID=W5WCG5_9PSEU|nr:hypothetical protein [Kutzneria albida]AHH98216.1 hypothetical protein KALB_4854 [Kutzneria albida DSM 43870]
MSNIYSDPDHFGLSIVKSHNASPAYQFNTIAVFRWDGWEPVRYFVAHDSGNSCFPPFEDIKLPHLIAVHTLADVDKFAREKWADLDLHRYFEEEGSAVDSAVAALMDGLDLSFQRGGAR